MTSNYYFNQDKYEKWLTVTTKQNTDYKSIKNFFKYIFVAHRQKAGLPVKAMK